MSKNQSTKKTIIEKQKRVAISPVIFNKCKEQAEQNHMRTGAYIEQTLINNLRNPKFTISDKVAQMISINENLECLSAMIDESEQPEIIHKSMENLIKVVSEYNGNI